MLRPLSQTPAAMAHNLCDDCGRWPLRYSVVSYNALACGTCPSLDTARSSRARFQPLPQSNTPIKTAIPLFTWLQPLPCSWLTLLCDRTRWSASPISGNSDSSSGLILRIGQVADDYVGQLTRWLFIARAAASMRLDTPSLARMLLMCVLTVERLTHNRRAISVLFSPSTIRASTSDSRSVSGSSGTSG